jgi:hypothetical protein
VTAPLCHLRLRYRQVLCCHLTDPRKPADGARTGFQPVSSSQLSAAARRSITLSTDCCRLAASLRASPWSVGGWIVLHARRSLVHWCCSSPGQGRAANPGWLLAAWVQRFSSTPRLSNSPNSRGPAPQLRYRSSTLSPPPCLSPTFFQASASLRTLLTGPPADIALSRHLRPSGLVSPHTGRLALESCLPHL